ncbi:DUF397 domain-containing protein [Streptomyces canus]|uniref:DUF397 domain-containing protein n=1 Tax=Streptomyces canus TaxID=58343 RepID=UPI00225381F8|nr:DUF397 domain-containing protein [Streptomyces canus]MCX5261774.1 DUF397 domain-containing protein [Streptomyces canus]
MRIVNGVPADSLHNVTWQKSRHSTADGNCVEVALQVISFGRVGCCRGGDR